MLVTPLGSYQPGTSVIHRLDSRIKSVTLVVIMIVSFSVMTPIQLGIELLGCAALITCSHLPIRSVTSCVMPLVPFALIVAVFNLFVLQGGTTLVTFGPFTISSYGAWAAFLYSVRLLSVIAVASLLLLTTTPTALTDAFDSLFSPLTHLGVPMHEISMVLSLSLRFVPILSAEAQAIMDAQTARGGSFEEGSALKRLKALSAIFVPIFAGALRHAQNLSRALDARCYEGGDARTRYRERHIGPLDLTFCALCLLWILALIFVR